MSHRRTACGIQIAGDLVGGPFDKIGEDDHRKDRRTYGAVDEQGRQHRQNSPANVSNAIADGYRSL